MRAWGLAVIVCLGAPVWAYEGGRTSEQPPEQPALAPVLTKAPELLRFVPSAYPETEKGQGEVEVVLVLFLDASGRVTKVDARPGAAPKAFVDLALAAAAGFVFSPAEVNGAPSAIGLEYRYVFTENLAASQPSTQAASQPAPSSVPRGLAVLVGEIREAGTRLRMNDATVRVVVGDFEAETTTDKRGAFRFENLPAGEAKIIVGAVAYRRFETKEKLEDRVETSVKLYVQRERLEPYEIVVRIKRETKEATRRVLSRAEIVSIPGTYGDPIRVVQNMPGVARPAFFGGQLVIRGAAPNDSEQFIDGMHLPGLYHFGGGPSVIPERMIEEVTFIPGGFGPRYGRSIAGIVDVRSREPDVRKWSGKFSADLGVATAFLEAPITDNTSITVAGRRSYIDAVLPLVLRLGQQNVANTTNPIIAPVFWDYQARLRHKTKNAGDFDLFVFGSDDRLRFVQTPTQTTSAFNPASLSVVLGFHSLMPSWTWKLSKNATNTVRLMGTRDTSHAKTPDVYFDLGEWHLGFRDDLEVKLTPNLTLSTGVDGIVVFYDFAAQLPLFPRFRQFPTPGSETPPFTTFKSSQIVNEVGLFAELDWKVGKLRVIPGLRLEHIGYGGRVRQGIGPRVTAKYEVVQDVTLKAATGLYQKRPPLQFITQDFGNLDLGLESAFQSTLGAEWQTTQALSIDGSVFYNYLWDQASPSSQILIRNGNVVPTLFENHQQGRTYGLELLIRHRPYKNFFGWIAYTLSRSERIDPNSRHWQLFTSDQTHILVLVASYYLPYGFQVGARFRVVSGNPQTPVAAAVYDADTGNYRRINGEARSIRLPAFHQLDVRLDKKFVFKTWTLGLYLDVQNVYNAKNAELFQYSYDFSQRQLFTGLPILPLLGVEGEF